MRIDMREGSKVNDDLVWICELNINVIFNGIRIENKENICAIDTIENWYVRFNEDGHEELIRVAPWIKLELRPDKKLKSEIVEYFNERVKSYEQSTKRKAKRS